MLWQGGRGMLSGTPTPQLTSLRYSAHNMYCLWVMHRSHLPNPFHPIKTRLTADLLQYDLHIFPQEITFRRKALVFLPFQISPFASVSKGNKSPSTVRVVSHCGCTPLTDRQAHDRPAGVIVHSRCHMGRHSISIQGTPAGLVLVPRGEPWALPAQALPRTWPTSSHHP